MTDSNRTQVTSVKEVTLGTTPNTPRMRTRRVNGERLRWVAQTAASEEIRADRMTSDPFKVGESSDGTIDFEFIYPAENSPEATDLESVFFNAWANTPSFDNDGTADSVITDAGTTTDTYVVASGGTAVKAGHLVRATGFTTPANNQIFKAASSTGTTVVGSSLSLSAETAPPGTARLKAVGFQGASGDITATANGLGSTSLDFTTLGLTPGMWLKIGGTATGDKFATAALNDWARVSGTVTATAIPLDNLPSGWTTDAGTGKTIKVWFGDVLKNGTTRIGQTIERGFLAQSVPTYIVQRGMVGSQLQTTIRAKQKIMCTITYLGMSGAESTTSLDASPDAAPSSESYPVMAASANVGRIAENGSALSSPNWVRELSFTINNNLRPIDAADTTATVNIGSGSCDVTVNLETYFGSDALLQKIMNVTPTNVNARAVKNGQAVIWSFPRLTPTDGSPNATARNTDVTLPIALSASKDSVTGAQVLMQRVEYYE